MCTCMCTHNTPSCMLFLLPYPIVSMFAPAPSGRQRAPFESSGSFEQPDLGHGVSGLGLEEAFTPELREKMARLEKENEIMRRRLDSSNITESIEPSLLGRCGQFPEELKCILSSLFRA